MPEDNNGVTYSFDVCGKCKIVCCQDARPPLSESRKKILKQYIKEKKVMVEEPFSKNSYSYPSLDADLLCCLFNKQTRRCSVHPVKPETCRAGPITFDINFQTKKAEWFLKKDSICPLAGELFKNKPALSAHLEAAKKEITRLIEELSADELRALHKIDEPETFKVGEDNLSPAVIKKLGLM